MTKLTPKRKKFVNAFVETGVAAEAARQAFDIPKDNNQLAASMGSEVLRNPEVQTAIAEKLKKREELVEEAHDSLLTAVRLDYFVFNKQMSDEEIKAHVESCGLTLISVRPSDKGKLAFFALPDGASRSKGVELFHKLQGTFAPEKRITLTAQIEPSDRLKELAQRLNKKL